MKRAGLVAVIGLACLAGCLAEGQFPCDSDAKCQKGATPGRCEQGFCAYEDGACTSSLRWDDTAPAGMMNQCVPPGDGDLGDLARPSDLFDAGGVVDLSMPDLAIPDLSTIHYCTLSVDTFNNGCQLK